MKLWKIFAVMGLILVACSTLPYQDDTGFLVSAQANSPEFPVYIGGSVCKDMDGNPGLCSKRIKSTDDVKIHFDAQSYSYNLTVSCTNPIVVPSVSVAENQAYDLVIPNAEFSGPGLLSFVCIGEVFPQDRTQPLSAKFEVRIVVTDASYQAREAVYIAKDTGGGNTLVLGEYARDAWVFDNGKWSKHSKDTQVSIKGDPTQVQAYSGSYQMRFNYFNFVGPVQ
jgi:hypothetical protein